jgi:hypothetical protein
MKTLDIFSLQQQIIDKFYKQNENTFITSRGFSSKPLNFL